MPKVKDLIEHLMKQYDQEEHIAAPIWSSPDVKGRAKELDITVSDEEVNEILDRMDDAELGISWDTIDDYLDSYGKETVGDSGRKG